MNLSISKDAKVYITAHANFATGGLEALHQLGRNIINELGIQAFMYYLPLNHPDPVHKEYKSYNVPIATEIEDDAKNVLIVPEVTFGISLLNSCKNIRKAVWWLSVDNFYGSRFAINNDIMVLSDRIINGRMSLFDGLNELVMNRYDNLTNLYRLLSTGENVLLTEAFNGVYLHLCQSHYALNHLKSKGINNIKYFTDYIVDVFLGIKIDEDDLSSKEDIVAYNPKGSDFSEKIKDYANKKDSNIKFIPVSNMSKEEVIALFKLAKAHINFGSHPGKDRITREAAYLGCCIITGKRGGAGYYEDIPIPDEFKFDDTDDNIPAIISKIKSCLNNFDDEYKKFEIYRKIVENEKNYSIKALRTIFKTI